MNMRWMKWTAMLLSLCLLAAMVPAVAEEDCEHIHSHLVWYDVVDYNIEPDMVSDITSYHLKITQPMIASDCDDCGTRFSGRPDGESVSEEELHTFDENGVCVDCGYTMSDLPPVGAIPINADTFPDANFRSYIRSEFDIDPADGFLTEAEREAVTEIDVSDSDITNLEGIDLFPALTDLDCTANELTSLDVSGCAALTRLDCRYNELTKLDVSGCQALTYLDCGNGGNELSSLDVSGCPALTELDCSDNELTSLDVSVCPALTKLNCDHNKLTSLDVSKCPALTELYCGFNKLTSLDVSKCPALTELDCSDNKLTSLDMSVCAALTVLDCYNNELTNLDVSECPALAFLICGWNQLTTLDVSGCAVLTMLSCRMNKLTSLDVTGYAALTELRCDNNRLKSLDVSGCDKLLNIIQSTEPQRYVSDESFIYFLVEEEGIITIDPTTDLIADGKPLYPTPTLTSTPELATATPAPTATTVPPTVAPTAVPTPTATPTSMPSASPSPFPTPTVTPSASPSPSPTPTATPTVTPSVSPSPTPSTTPTATPTPTPISIKKCTITGIAAKTYTGKAIKPAPVVKHNGVKLKKGTDYTVSYKNNTKIGLATVTIKGKGAYTGTVNKTFKINPKKVTLSKLTAGKKQLTVQWKKGAGNITGYEIQYSLKKNMSGAKTVTVKKAKTVKTTIKKLKSKKTYYVRIRAYAKVSGKKYVSAWSKVLSKKVK